MVPNNDSWFYIRSVATGGVITVGQPDGASATLRSQVYVCPPERTDDELWQWDGQYLRNKATDLVLDIRKGMYTPCECGMRVDKESGMTRIKEVN